MLRRLIIASVLALAALPISGRAAAVAPAASVVAVKPSRVADLVMLGRGFDAGLRQGMVCRVSRGVLEIAEILVVDLRRTCSAALILSVTPGQAIRTGDVAAIKVFKS